MNGKRWTLLVSCVALLSQPITGQTTPRAADLIGAWQLVSAKDVKTGAVTPSTGTSWIQFTRSHWTVLSMDAGRNVISNAEFDKLPPDAQVKTNYARVWDAKNQQIFAARGGTYTLAGDKLHHPAMVAIYTNIIGVDRVLKIIRLDKTTLVAQTQYPDDPTTHDELTYRRID